MNTIVLRCRRCQSQEMIIRQQTAKIWKKTDEKSIYVAEFLVECENCGFLVVIEERSEVLPEDLKEAEEKS